MSWLWLWILLIVINAENIDELSEKNIIFTNHTELPVARIEIGTRKLEGSSVTGIMGVFSDKVLIAVSPEVHDIKVTFRGGAVLEFRHLDFKGIHEVILERNQNQIYIHTE